MSSPYEHRELLLATFKWNTDKTVDDLKAERRARQERARREAQREAKSGGRPGGRVPMKPLGPPSKADMDALKALTEQAAAARARAGK